MANMTLKQKLKKLDDQIQKLRAKRAHLINQAPPLDVMKTQDIANVLNVSRPHVTKLMDDGLLKHHRVGAHRRAFRKDVEDFKARMYGSIPECSKNGTMTVASNLES